MLEPHAIAEALTHAPEVMRVVIAAHQGSSPRENGTAMIVWASAKGGGQSGTIGGGALEYLATEKARALLAEGRAGGFERVPLGPAIGQCCGGAVSLAYERFDAARLAGLPEAGGWARPVEPGAGEMPLPMARALRGARQGQASGVLLKSGWLFEPMAAPRRPLWIWGAGHVGRAMVATLQPLPDFAITWIDTERARFPEAIPAGLVPLIGADPAGFADQAPRNAEHLIVTFSHALDLELCHRILGRGHKGLGVIGSATKAARFRSRLAALGHAPAAVWGLRCPIGDPTLGKHPQAIAISVAAELLRMKGGAALRHHENESTLREANQP